MTRQPGSPAGRHYPAPWASGDPRRRIPALPAVLAYPGGHRRRGRRPLHAAAIPARPHDPRDRRGHQQQRRETDLETASIPGARTV